MLGSNLLEGEISMEKFERVEMRFKGRVEKREALTNGFLHLEYEGTEFCVSGTFPAEFEWSDTDGNHYKFWFWTFDGMPAYPDPSDPAPPIPPVGIECVSKAVQWYYKTGTTGEIPTMFMWAFSMGTGTFLNDSPIAAPPEAVGQNHVVTQDKSWILTAKDYIGSGNLTEPFHHWWRTGSSPQAQGAKNLTVPQGLGGSAVAFYGADPAEKPPGPDVGKPTIVKPHKDTLPEVKAGSYDFEDLRDFMNRVQRRLDQLEQKVDRGHSFIRSAERPKIGGPDPTRGKVT